LDDLRATLEQQFRTTVTAFEAGAHAIELTHPVSADDLIDEADFERDERLPYWADVWPSARVLAQVVAGRRGAGKTLLELGCGAGLVATAAALSGFRVCATDYYEEALLFTELNVRHNAHADNVVLETRLVDWRRIPTTLGRFDMVVGSDVLYEREYGALVARAIDMTLAAGGEAVIADPGRIAAADFVRDARTRGLHVVSHEQIPFSEGQIRQSINLYRFRR
jgi:predicted nicotinamide N-methyase